MMARSRALDRVRTRSAREAAVDRLEHEQALGSRSAEATDEAVLRRDGVRTALRAVRELPLAQREAVALSFAGGLSAREIAATTASRSAPPRAVCGSAWSRRASGWSRSGGLGSTPGCGAASGRRRL